MPHRHTSRRAVTRLELSAGGVAAVQTTRARVADSTGAAGRPVALFLRIMGQPRAQPGRRPRHDLVPVRRAIVVVAPAAGGRPKLHGRWTAGGGGEGGVESRGRIVRAGGITCRPAGTCAGRRAAFTLRHEQGEGGV